VSVSKSFSPTSFGSEFAGRAQLFCLLRSSNCIPIFVWFNLCQYHIMSRTILKRLWAQSSPTILSEPIPHSQRSLQCLRAFSYTPRRRAEEDSANPTPPQQQNSPRASVEPTRSESLQRSPSLHPKAKSTKGTTASSPPASAMSALSSLLESNQNTREANRSRSFLDLTSMSSDGSFLDPSRYEEPHHFHVYATKHNTHLTVTRPNRDPLISVSTGNIGFKKAARGKYDSAFQLTSYVMGRMQESGMNMQIKKLEVILRGFGQGREAVSRAFLGHEGRFLREKIVKVADATRLKFGGTRSKKPRRLG
jgi:small subunit ribosomal protein S11